MGKNSLSFDFDREVSRLNTHAVKYDGRTAMFGTDDVEPMWVADMDFAAPEAVTQALMTRAAHPVYGYTLAPESAYTALMDWMAQRHDWKIEREWIMLMPGVVPSINATVMALTQPGEGVIVQPPVYFPFFTAATHTGRGLVENPLRLENGHYSIDFEHLEACAAHARLLLLCSPHNPVGRVWREDELQQLLDIVRRHDLLVLSDEIHADLVYPGYCHRPLVALAGNDASIITAVAPSKTFNIPGLGLSTLIVPDPGSRQAIRQVLEQLHVSAANPFSLAAFEAAYRAGGPWRDALMTYLQETQSAVAHFIATHLPGIRMSPAEGTYLLWLDCRGLQMSDAELKRFMIHEARLGLSPGPLFGAGGSGFMRLNIGAPRKRVLQALRQWAAALDRRGRESDAAD
jgi:cystathionine beta-lyase